MFGRFKYVMTWIHARLKETRSIRRSRQRTACRMLMDSGSFHIVLHSTSYLLRNWFVIEHRFQRRAMKRTLPLPRDYVVNTQLDKLPKILVFNALNVYPNQSLYPK